MNCKQIFWCEENLDEKCNNFLMLSVNRYEQMLRCIYTYVLKWLTINCTKIKATHAHKPYLLELNSSHSSIDHSRPKIGG